MVPSRFVALPTLIRMPTIWFWFTAPIAEETMLWILIAASYPNRVTP